MLKDESAVVPDGIVFGVLCEQGRRQAERLGCVFLRFDLDMFLASGMAECLEGHTFACSLSTRAWYASICLSSFLRAASVFSLTATRGTPCCTEVNFGQPASFSLANSHSCFEWSVSVCWLLCLAIKSSSCHAAAGCAELETAPSTSKQQTPYQEAAHATPSLLRIRPGPSRRTLLFDPESTLSYSHLLQEPILPLFLAS